MNSYLIVFRFHLGTAAFGGLIIAFVQFLRYREREREEGITHVIIILYSAVLLFIYLWLSS